jgi:hypothetical protein
MLEESLDINETGAPATTEKKSDKKNVVAALVTTFVSIPALIGG